jgi:hypothetical protein
MKILKRILLGILALIVFLLLLALVVPKEMEAKSEITINKPQAEVYEYIQYVKNQDKFGKWQKMDPNMKTKSEGTDGTVGFKYSWDSEVLDQGSQTITKVNEGKGIETELYFGFGEPARSFLYTEPINENQTKVVWGIEGKSQYPYNLMNLVYNMDKDFQEGLQNLKKELEN